MGKKKKVKANYILLGMLAGLRPEEILRLQWKDIKNNRGSINE